MAVTPGWTDYSSTGPVNAIIVSQDVASTAVARGTLDLRTKFAAYIFIRIGRTVTNALTAPVSTRIRRTLAGNTINHPGNVFSADSLIAACVEPTVAVNSNSGQNILSVSSSASMAVGDYILIGSGTAREEWARISRINSNDLHLDTALKFTHTLADADPVANKAECYDPQWVVGGAIIEVIVDNGGSGRVIRAEVLAQTYDQDANA